MQDPEHHLEKLRIQIAECEMIRDFATAPKRGLFTRLAEHFKVLATEIEKAMTDQTAIAQDHEPLPKASD